jgi:uncharacterized membrane protein YraQ (UPF0718 family)
MTKYLAKSIITMCMLALITALVTLAAPLNHAFADAQKLEQLEASQKADSNSTADCKTNATPNGTSQATAAQIQKCLKDNKIFIRLNEIVNFLAAGVGIVVTGVIIVGGIQYILAGDNATGLQAARQRIINGLIALFAFLFMYAFLQWLIPGGVFGGS